MPDGSTLTFADGAFLNHPVEIVALRLTGSPDAIFQAAALLSEGERERAQRFAVDEARRQYVITRAALRRLLADRLGISPGEVELTVTARGKPVLGGMQATADLRFNLSHSGDVAIFGFTCGRDIGVDVESAALPRHADAIATRFFSPAELQAYNALDAADRPLGFFNAWTRKEAFIKAIGEGLSYPLDRFDVSLAPGVPARLIRVDSTMGAAEDWPVISFTPFPDYVAAVVIDARK